MAKLAFNFGVRQYTKGKISYQQYLKAIKPRRKK